MVIAALTWTSALWEKNVIFMPIALMNPGLIGVSANVAGQETAVLASMSTSARR